MLIQFPGSITGNTVYLCNSKGAVSINKTDNLVQIILR